MKKKNINSIIRIILVIFLCFVIFTNLSCSKINIELFGIKFGEKTEEISSGIINARVEKDKAFENYKEIWLKYPLNEYSEIAWESLTRLSDEGAAGLFVPTANQIYNRGEIFFNIYNYYSALDEFNRILQEDYLNTLSVELHSRALFKMGMCYFRLRDYNQAKYYLQLSYEKSPSGSVADDSLYYTGMTLTSLNMNDDAISYYRKLVRLFPSSNFSDDALYRIGRIYSLRGDFVNAASYFKRVSTDYPMVISCLMLYGNLA